MTDDDGIPDGALVNAHVEVVQYVDPGSSEIRYTTRYFGDVPLSSFIGLLELAKLDLIREARDW